MNIGEASAASGVSAKMIRYYEATGLIPKPARSDAGYRRYTEREINTLRFIRRAREFGLPMPRIERLIGLWLDRERPSREVKKIALDHVAELRTKIDALSAMADALERLAGQCHGDGRPDCPILHDLESPRPHTP